MFEVTVETVDSESLMGLKDDEDYKDYKDVKNNNKIEEKDSVKSPDLIDLHIDIDKDETVFDDRKEGFKAYVEETFNDEDIEEIQQNFDEKQAQQLYELIKRNDSLKLIKEKIVEDSEKEKGNLKGEKGKLLTIVQFRYETWMSYCQERGLERERKVRKEEERWL